MRDLGEALALWLLERGVQEDAVGTSLRHAWLKEVSVVVSMGDLLTPAGSAPHVAVLERASTQAQLAVGAPETDAPISVRIRHVAGEAHGPVVAALEEALKPPASEQHSGPDLAALADLHRGGDPEDRLRRDARLRVVITLAAIVLGVFGAALGILVGTGVIVW